MKRFSSVFVRKQTRPAFRGAIDPPRHCGLRPHLVAGLLLLTVSGSLIAQDNQAVGGQKVYMDNCSVCHGESGDGKSGARFGLNPPPASFVDNYSATREQMLAVVTHGIPGTAMVGWGTRLSDIEIAAAVDYVTDTFVEPPEPSGAAVPGAESYASNCSVCHGETGKGAVWGREGLNPPPVDFTDEAATQGLTRARMIASVIHGRPGTAMVGYGGRLPHDEIEAMVDYIRSEFMGVDSSVRNVSEFAKGVPPRDYMGYESVPMETPMPSELKGNAARGAALFAASCVSCHGIEGKGDGPRAYFIFPRPRDFTSPESRRALNRPAIFTAVQHGVRGREMPAWRLVLSEQEIADVTEYVASAFIDAQ